MAPGDGLICKRLVFTALCAGAGYALVACAALLGIDSGNAIDLDASVDDGGSSTEAATFDAGTGNGRDAKDDTSRGGEEAGRDATDERSLVGGDADAAAADSYAEAGSGSETGADSNSGEADSNSGEESSAGESGDEAQESDATPIDASADVAEAAADDADAAAYADTCVPYPQPCGARACGQATDGCGVLVSCGPNGGNCPTTSDLCQPDGTCCSPDNATACSGRCGGTVQNNCGTLVTCPNACPSGHVCYQDSCCAPINYCGNKCNVSLDDGCGGFTQCSCSGSEQCIGGTCCTPGACVANCMDNCGQYSPACCMDSGPPPFDGGACFPSGMPCNSNAQCCSQICMPGIMPPPDGGVVGLANPPMRCQ